MKKTEIEVGKTYAAKVSNRIVPVRIDAVSEWGGWNGTNMNTGRLIRIRGAQRLRRLWIEGNSENTK